DVDEPENEGGGQARIPSPPDAPGAAAPERTSGEHDGAEDDTDFSSGESPGVGDLRAFRMAAAEGEESDGAEQADGEEEEREHGVGHMVVEDVRDLALHGVAGRDVNGLIEAPD